ncbi:MAG: GNAT family N-acetyltransferase [Rhodospirillales bacterium]
MNAGITRHGRRSAQPGRRKSAAIVAAGAAHPALMAAVHATAFLPDEAWGTAIFAGHLSMQGTFGFLHEAGGVVLARAAADEAEILTLAVAPEARRRGVARGLLRAAVEAARTRGAATLFLEVSAANSVARALYESEGFAPVGKRRGYYEDGTDALVLALKLSPGANAER